MRLMAKLLLLWIRVIELGNNKMLGLGRIIKDSNRNNSINFKNNKNNKNNSNNNNQLNNNRYLIKITN